MDFLYEKYVARGLRDLLGDEVWLSLSKIKRAALISFFTEYGNNMMTTFVSQKQLPEVESVIEIAKNKVREVERLEILALLKNDKREFPDIGIHNFRVVNENFRRMRERMEELLAKLKELKFKHPEMEKRRLHIIDAFELKAPIPADEYDLWVINKVLPGTLDEESVKKIDEWVESFQP